MWSISKFPDGPLFSSFPDHLKKSAEVEAFFELFRYRTIDILASVSFKDSLGDPYFRDDVDFS